MGRKGRRSFEALTSCICAIQNKKAPSSAWFADTLYANSPSWHHHYLVNLGGPNYDRFFVMNINMYMDVLYMYVDCRLHIYVHICIHVYTFAHMPVHTDICMYICMYIQQNMFMSYGYMCIHVCIYRYATRAHAGTETWDPQLFMYI